jgi:prepilin-type N-terminal cleavage/methylation domain-containing protein
MNTPKSLKIRGTAGFTLVELLVVITIIVILTALTIGAMGLVQKMAAVKKCRAQMALLENGLEQYHADTGIYPEGNTSLAVYQALFGDGVGPDGVLGTLDDEAADGKPDDGAKIYLPDLDPQTNPSKMVKVSGSRATGLIDPFGGEYIYMGGASFKTEMNNPDFDLSSKGPDGKNKTPAEQGDDLKNW